MSTSHVLVADIGGTNFRFGIVPSNSLLNILFLSVGKVSDYNSVTEAVKEYLQKIDNISVNKLILSVASPVIHNKFHLTNGSWYFDINDISTDLNIKTVHIINDLTALSLAIPFLSITDYYPIKQKTSSTNHNKAIVSCGTGLGVSALFNINNCWYPLASEGGHIDYDGLFHYDLSLDNFYTKTHSISAETLLSGRGITLLYNMVSKNNGNNKLSNKEITERALNKTCLLAVKTMHIYCKILADFSRSVVLMFGAKGGLYIGGGITSSIFDLVIQSDLIKYFAKGEYAKYLADIPVYIIKNKNAALLGAAAINKKKYQYLGIKND